MTEKRRGKPGPEAERLKLDGNWREAVRKAVRKGKPPRKGKKKRRAK
jgi:hypothetical protein